MAWWNPFTWGRAATGIRGTMVRGLGRTVGTAGVVTVGAVGYNNFVRPALGDPQQQQQLQQQQQQQQQQQGQGQGGIGEVINGLGQSGMFGWGSLIGAVALGGAGAYFGGTWLAVGGAILGGLATQPIINAFTGGGHETAHGGTGGRTNGGGGQNPHLEVAQNPPVEVPLGLPNGPLNNGIRQAPGG